MAKNKHAVALGRRAKGVKKNLSDEERKRRGEIGGNALRRWHERNGHNISVSVLSAATA